MINQRWWRIVPVAFGMYTIAYVDRTNISMALPSMSRELHMDPVQAGAVAGIFFWGYMIFQIPSGHLAKRWSAKRLISILLVLWGASAVGCGLVQTWQELRIMRFVLGICEGGVLPAILILLSHWFPRAERARANGLWGLCIPLSIIVSAPLSGWILDRWNWRVMLVAEGLLPIGWLVVWLVCMSDAPENDQWISPEEREALADAFARETQDLEPKVPASYLGPLLSRQTAALAGVHFFHIVGQIGFIIWLPSALKAAGKLTNLRVGLLFTLPFIVGAISMVLNSQHSDKSSERRGHVGIPLAAGGLFLLTPVLVGQRFALFSLVFVCLAAIGSYAPLGPFWAIPTETLGQDAVGPAIGVINALGNLGGYFGPVMLGYLNRETGGFRLGFGVLAAAMLMGAAMTLLIKPRSKLPPR